MVTNLMIKTILPTQTEKKERMANRADVSTVKKRRGAPLIPIYNQTLHTADP